MGNDFLFENQGTVCVYGCGSKCCVCRGGLIMTFANTLVGVYVEHRRVTQIVALEEKGVQTSIVY